MKRIYPSIAILLSLAIVSNAQNTSPYWSLAGNNNATSSSKLGTTNAINLRMFTNNVERMRITTAGLVGIGTTSPNSRLHVNSPSGENPLRAQINASTKFLVSSNGGVAVGANLTPPANGLYVSGNVGIGTNVPSYKLHVVASGTAIYGRSNSSNGNYYGVFGSSPYIGVYGEGSSYGVYGSANSFGLYGYGGAYGAYATGTSYGVYGNSGNIGIYGDGVKYGVYGVSTNGSALYGNTPYGYAVYGNSLYGQGVTGISTNGTGGVFNGGSYGVYATGTFYAGYFVGKVYSSGGYTSSDKKLKQDITDVPNAMEIIKKLKPKYYHFRQDGNYKFMNLPEGKHYGLIAQDIEQVLPNLVADAEFNTAMLPDVKSATESVKPGGPNPLSPINQDVKEKKAEIISFKALNYTELIPILIKGMQELDARNAALQNEVNELRLLISKNNETRVTSSVGYLKQNSPNPFNANTIIGYYIPDNAGSAQIKITDVKGSLIKTFSAAKGEGQINIKSGQLPAGTYNYTLYINGKTADTRQMLLIK